MLKGISSVLSFLTIFPADSSDLQTIAKNMYLFPMIGAAIGIIVGFMGFGLFELGLESLVVALIVTTAIMIITGGHHADGLADFADGIMLKGTQERKIAVMKDPVTGSAGIAAIVLYIVSMIIALSLAKGWDLFQAILIAEIMAKFSMVLMAYVGRSAIEGSNTPFLQAMKSKKRLLLALIITIVPVLILGQSRGIVIFAIDITLVLLLVWLSSRSFGGITGDVLGATNEITRVASVLTFVSI